MITWVQPAERIFARSPCNSKLSGVVRSVSRTSSPIMLQMVPIRPTFAPIAVSSSSFRRYVTEVFPFVPVTPMIFMSSAGCPYQFPPSCAKAFLEEAT